MIECCAVGIAIERQDGRTFYGLRSPDHSKEYKSFWSIPSLTVTQDEFYSALKTRRLPNNLLARVSQQRLGGTPLKGGDLLISGNRQRTRYLLRMAIFSASLVGSPPISSQKYKSFRFFDPREYATANGKLCGTSCSLHFQSLINRGSLESTFSCLEIPPELADSQRELEDCSPEELWRLAAPNYSLLVKGETGGDGHILMGLTLDRFLDVFLRAHIDKQTRVLDVGCGEGRLLEKIAARTDSAYGLELVDELPLRASIRDRVVRGNLLDAVEIFGEARFNLIILNLMLFWLPDLDTVARVLRSLLLKNAQILLTATTPEFTKSGKWEGKDGAFAWVVTEPLRRGKLLAMINRCVGPLWFYPRSTVDVLAIFGKHGLNCTGGEHVFVDSYLTQDELANVYDKNPSLKRHAVLPAFTALNFVKTE